eukprot:6205970-Pleurochrysis_carterae.AAC.4
MSVEQIRGFRTNPNPNQVLHVDLMKLCSSLLVIYIGLEYFTKTSSINAIFSFVYVKQQLHSRHAISAEEKYVLGSKQ